MKKVKHMILSHKGLLFLILILAFFVVINVYSYLLKKEPPKVLFNGQEEVKILSKLPITDASAKDLDISNIQSDIIGYAEFSLELEAGASEETQYEIYLTDITDSDVFKYDYVKVYLTDENDNPYKQFEVNKVPSYTDMRISLSAPEKRILLAGTIKPSEVKKFKLRIWVADTYVLDNNEKEFKGRISVKTIF